MVVGVLVELSNKNIDKTFDYLVPKELIDNIKIGIRVEVPFGKQKLEGFVLEIKKESDRKLKEIISIVDKDIILNDELLQLGKKMQQMTLATLISCYQVMLPKALKAKYNTSISKKYDIYYKLKELKNEKFNDKQKEIIDKLQKQNIVSRKELLEISSSSINTLLKKNIIEEVKKERYRLQYEDKELVKQQLTSSQQNVVDEVLETKDENIFLLHGVTGSGKTEVYMELIENAINNNKTSIVLVPEISLTPQMIERFQKRFGNIIAALHSALSEGEKYDEYRRIARGEVKIVIGARSAIFAPLSNIGIIIIDEEHSESYKQDNNPRYNAKNIAILRAKYNNCKVIMGSATPSLESYARALNGNFHLLQLPNRVNGKNLPNINLIDMNKEIKTSKGHFSKELLESINDKINNNEQVILLLNRRGYASFVTCKNCGYTFKCPHCDITLTYHKISKTLRCHYCGYATKVYDTCPSCHEKSINDLGVGTEKIEEELNKFIPTARILRMDVDTTSKKGMHQKMIKSFKNHDYDILLGTQIVAKGLDFDNVTLVGVINADTSLNIPDFRSSENTFSLLSQVAGRSGRSKKSGNVIIQTFNIDHYAIKYAKNHDYVGFYNQEMKIRNMLKYPPYFHICYIKISSKDENYAKIESLKIKNALDRNLQSSIILGPSACGIFKLNNIYRYGIIIKYKKDSSIIPTLNKLLDHYKSISKIKIDIDFNPTHF